MLFYSPPTRQHGTTTFFEILSDLNQVVPNHQPQTRVNHVSRIHHRTIFRWCIRKTVRWCIRLMRLTLVCEVIRYRLVQAQQNLKKKKTFRVGGHQSPSLSLPLSFSSSSYFLSSQNQNRQLLSRGFSWEPSPGFLEGFTEPRGKTNLTFTWSLIKGFLRRSTADARLAGSFTNILSEKHSQYEKINCKQTKKRCACSTVFADVTHCHGLLFG